MNKSALFSLTLENDILWRYAEIRNFTGVVELGIKWLSEQVMSKSTDIYIEVLDGSVYFKYDLEYIKNDGNSWFFKILEKHTLGERGIIVDYKEPLYIKFISESSLPAYLNKSYMYNLEESSILSHISALIGSDDGENRALIKFMVQLNTKLDTILDSLEKSSEEDVFKIQGVGVNMSNFILHSRPEIAEGRLGFVKCMMGSFDIKFRFASVIKFAKLKKAFEGCFYKADFIGLQEDTRDKLINYVFSRERELIRNARDKGDFY